MPTITTTPISPDRWDDVQRIFAGGGDGRTCQCVWPTMRNVDFSRASIDERTEAFRDDVGSDRSPGLILYVDDEPAGWVRVGPRPTQTRIVRTRGLADASGIPVDDDSVWAVTCFSIPRGHRRQGLMAKLLAAAVEHARAHGTRVVEAYPRDPANRKTSANDLFVGSIATFEQAGFDVVAPLGATKHVVQLAL